MVDPKTEYRIRMQMMYTRYMAHCKANGVHPAPFRMFQEKVEIHMAKKLSQKMVDKVPEEDRNNGILMVALTESGPFPEGTKLDICGRCKRSVSYDPTILEQLGSDIKLICVECMSEVTGKSLDQLLTEKLKDL